MSTSERIDDAMSNQTIILRSSIQICIESFKIYIITIAIKKYIKKCDIY